MIKNFADRFTFLYDIIQLNFNFVRDFK